MMNTLHPAHPTVPADVALAARARVVFRHACEGTDSYHALRLSMARRRALNAPRHSVALRLWAPLAGAAACCALVVGIVWTRPTFHAAATTIASPVATTEPEPEVGSSQMDIAQNLDFYRWLAAQPSVASAPSDTGR